MDVEQWEPDDYSSGSPAAGFAVGLAGGRIWRGKTHFIEEPRAAAVAAVAGAAAGDGSSPVVSPSAARDESQGSRQGSGGRDRHAYSMLLVTSLTCQFCSNSNSTAFRRRLVEAALSSGVPLWIRFQGVGSIILIDSSCLIRRTWLGQRRQDEGLDALAVPRYPSHVTPPPRKPATGGVMLTAAEPSALSARNSTTVVSLEERGHFAQEHPAGAINIPLRELGMRAGRELRRDALNVLDCSATADAVCSIVLEDLRKEGFRAAVVDFGQFHVGY